MTETEVMATIKQLSFDYLWHCNDSFFKHEHVKSTLAFELCYQASTPQKVVDELHKKHEFEPYRHLLKHQVLVLNRTPWWLLFIQTFFIAITCPLSVPFLMIWSWVNRGTPNFMRTAGSIFLEKVLTLCRQAGVHRPTQAIIPAFPIELDARQHQNHPTVSQGVNMQSYRQMQALGGATTAGNNGVPPGLAIPFPAQLPTLAEDVNGMANMAQAFTQVMIDNPTLFIESEVEHTNGKSVFMASPPFERINDRIFLQKFDYASAWTKPWQELDEFSSQVHVFQKFNFVRRPQKTDKKPANITPPTGRLERTYAAGLALFRSDSKALLEKARKTCGPAAHRFYLEALETAKNNEEYTNVMEVLINHHCRGTKDIEEMEDRYTPEYFKRLIDGGIYQLNRYIDQLPENYYLCSSTARTLEAYFARVWGLLEEGKASEAWDAFGKDELFEKCKMKILIQTPFVQKCLPHLVAMWYQLSGLFHIIGASGEIIDSAEEEGRRTLLLMEKALKALQEHSLPDATAFEQTCVEPLRQMQAHAETLFQQVPRETARQYAIQSFRDLLAWKLEERCSSYRHERRGTHFPYMSLFPVARTREIIAQIDAMQQRETSRTRLTM